MPLRVMLIEDEPSIIAAISFLLERDGWEVLTHAHGPTALEALRAARPDAAILDVMLPGASGYDILRALRADAELAGLPVLMLTARGHDRDRDLALQSGASSFMSKPFSNADMIAQIRALVAG